MIPRINAFIFARGNSKGVPRKNLQILGDKPLIAHAILAARACTLVQRVIVSTDNAEIAAVAQDYGAEVPFMRPAQLAEDESPEWLAWQHAVQQVDPFDLFVSVPATAPLRSVDDIEACIRQMMQGHADLVLTVKPAERSPYFNMVRLDGDHFAQLVIPPSQGVIHRRQDAPPVYDIVPVAYVSHPDFILKANSLFEGQVQAVIVPPERAVDIDTELDLKFAEFLLSQRRA